MPALGLYDIDRSADFSRVADRKPSAAAWEFWPVRGADQQAALVNDIAVAPKVGFLRAHFVSRPVGAFILADGRVTDDPIAKLAGNLASLGIGADAIAVVERRAFVDRSVVQDLSDSGFLPIRHPETCAGEPDIHGEEPYHAEPRQ